MSDAREEVRLDQEAGRVRSLAEERLVQELRRGDLELRREEIEADVGQQSAGKGPKRLHVEEEPIVLRLLQEAVAPARIVELTDVPLRTIYRRQSEWIDAGILEDFRTPEHRQRSGTRVNAQQEQLMRRRLELGWAQQEIADALGVSHGTVARRAAKWGFSKNPRPLVGDEAMPFPFPIPYAELDRNAKRALSPTAAGFKFFHEHYLGLRFDPWADELAAELLAAYETNEKEFIVLNAPPGCGKTTALTYAFVLWVIVRERAYGRWVTISLGHREEGKAKWYVQRVRSALETNPKLQTDFGFFRPKGGGRRWSGSELDVEPLDWSKVLDKEPTVTAGSYLGATLSGRYDLSIWDDLIDQQNSATLEQRRKLERWNDVEAETRVEAGGLYVLSNARYGPEDLSHALIRATDPDETDSDGKARKMYRHLAYSAHYDELCDGKHHTGPWPNGCLLSPDRISWNTLRHHRAKDDSRYELVWLNHDGDPMGSLANPLWFTGGVEKSTGFQFPGCFQDDLIFGQRPPAIEKKTPDVSAVTVDPGPSRYWALEHWLAFENIQLLFNAARPQMSAPELLYQERDGAYTGYLEDFWQFAARRGCAFNYAIVEVNTAQKWLLQYPFVSEWAIARGVTFVRHTTGVTKADPDRGVEMLRPLYKAGQCWLPTGGHAEQLFSEQLKREACAWPEGSSDDLVMAHWFFNAKLPTLLTASAFDAATEPDTGVPAFARAMSVPAFARR